MRYIRKFQREHGLVDDGIIGKHTLRKMKVAFQLQNAYQLGHFLGQVAEETGNFRYGTERLNYSAKRLLEIFSKYFNEQTAAVYARNEQAIANRVYANRNGNGDTASNDGWNFRGRGAIQLTGRANYTAFAQYMNDPSIITDPNRVEKRYYWDTALWYFKVNGIWQHTTKMNIPTIRRITKIINGGYNGIDHRIKLTKHFYQLARTI